MTLRLSFKILICVSIFGCDSQDKVLPSNIKVTACYKTAATLKPTSNRLPMVKILNGDSTVFDFVRFKDANQKIVNGDTVTTADTDLFERVTFAIKSSIETFTITTDSLSYLNGFYEFHGGESPLANTDFKIKKGFIKGHKQNDSWLIEASISVVDRQETDSIIKQIRFTEVFKNCN